MHELVIPAYIGAVLLVTASSALADDAACRKLVIGRWHREIEKQHIIARSVTEFHRDGRFVQNATIVDGQKTIPLHFSGKWTLTDGRLTYFEDRGLPPTSDELISITDGEIRSLDSDGKISVKRRVDPASAGQRALSGNCSYQRQP